MAAPVILVEAQPRRVVDGVPVVARLAGGGGAVPYLYGGNHYRAGIDGLPRIVTSIDFDGQEFGGGSVPQAMALRWAPGGSAAIAELAAYHWNDAQITVRVGPEGALPPVLTAGTVLSAASDSGALSIALSDPAADLRKPILTARFAGTGGVEGPVEWKDRIKPRAWGRVFNLPGEPLDKANNIYCFGDPQFAWAEFVEVRDKGAAASPAAIVLLAWQGSVAATFAALQAAAAPQGGGVVCPSIACVKWWTQPAGSLCADIRGEVGAGYVETAASIAARIAGVVSAVPFAAGTVTAANAARPVAVGWLAKDDSGTAAAALDKLLGDVSLLWVLDQDAIAIRRWEWTAPVAAARSISVQRKQTFKPVSRRRLGYRQNQNVMSRDAIAGIVFVSNIEFETGEALHDRLEAMAQATEAIEALASGKGKPWFQATPPTAAESSEQDLWFDTGNGNFPYRRVPGNGRISYGGTVVTFGAAGAIVYRPWAPAGDARIATALAQAAAAISQAQAAQQTADEAVSSIEAMGDDGILTGVEKKQLKIDDGRLDAAWAILDVQAAAFGVTTERTAAATARNNWLTLRNAISPAWDNADVDSAIDRAGFIAVLKAYDEALTALQKAISAKAATTASWDGVTGTGKDQLLADAATAKANAAASLAQISIIQSDGYLSAGEKRDLKATVGAIQAEYPGIIAKAAAQSVSSTVYANAYSALLAYLGTLSPSWDNTALDTAVVATTFNGKFTDYYFARTDLLIACADLTLANVPTFTIATSLEIAADYTGAIAAGTLPKYLTPDVKVGGVDRRTDNLSTYQLGNWTGGCTNANTTIDNTNGSATKGRVAIDATWNASGTVDVTFFFNNVAIKTERLTFTKKVASPPSGSGSGSGGYTKNGNFDPTGQSVSTTSYVVTGQVLNMVKGTGETIRGVFNGTYDASGSGNVVTRNMLGYFRYSPAGANSWTAMGSAVTGSNATMNNLTGDSSQGSITVNQSATPANGNYDVQFVAAINSTLNGAVLTVAVGSGSVIIS